MTLNDYNIQDPFQMLQHTLTISLYRSW